MPGQWRGKINWLIFQIFCMRKKISYRNNSNLCDESGTVTYSKQFLILLQAVRRRRFKKLRLNEVLFKFWLKAYRYRITWKLVNVHIIHMYSRLYFQVFKNKLLLLYLSVKNVLETQTRYKFVANCTWNCRYFRWKVPWLARVCRRRRLSAYRSSTW